MCSSSRGTEIFNKYKFILWCHGYLEYNQSFFRCLPHVKHHCEVQVPAKMNMFSNETCLDLRNLCFILSTCQHYFIKKSQCLHLWISAHRANLLHQTCIADTVLHLSFFINKHAANHNLLSISNNTCFISRGTARLSCSSEIRTASLYNLDGPASPLVAVTASLIFCSTDGLVLTNGRLCWLLPCGAGTRQFGCPQ